MATCRKCGAENEEGLTRCKSCNAILPVKIGSKSQVRYERVRRKAELVGIKCPSCGALNPYTQFRCKQCGSLLSKKEEKSSFPTVWVATGLALAVVVIVIAVVIHGG